eukprot:3670979-Alexandrium_andersonii.AAC.1
MLHVPALASPHAPVPALSDACARVRPAGRAAGRLSGATSVGARGASARATSVGARAGPRVASLV